MHTQFFLRHKTVVVLGVIAIFSVVIGGTTMRAQVSSDEGTSDEFQVSSTEAASSEFQVSGEENSSALSSESVSSESNLSSVSNDTASSLASDDASSAASEESSSASSESSADTQSSSLSSSEQSSSSEESSASSTEPEFVASGLLVSDALIGKPGHVFPSFLVPKTADFSDAYDVQKRVKITLTDDANIQSEMTETVTDEKSDYRVTMNAPSSFRPGHYRFVATLDRTSTITEKLTAAFRALQGQDPESDLVLVDEYLDWGTVAVNTDSNEYVQGDTVTVSAALMAENGSPLCVEKLSGSFDDGKTDSIQTFCNEEDKKLTLYASVSGDALLNVTALDKEVSRAVQNLIHINVETPLLNVRRTSVTYTTPQKEETMTLVIESTAMITGTIHEHVPAGFVVLDTKPTATSIAKNADGTRITWDGQFTAGARRTFSYTYTTPADAPIMGLFGPVDIKGEKEGEVKALSSVSSTEASSSEDQVSSTEASSSMSQDSSSEATSSEDQVSSEKASSESSSAEAGVSSEEVSSSESQVSSEVSTASEGETSQVDAPEETPQVGTPAVDGDSSSTAPSEPLSFLNSFFSHLLASLVIDDSNHVSYKEDKQWEVLSLSGKPTFAAAERERRLTLERTAQVFEANASPTFQLVDTNLSDDVRLLDGDNHLKPEIAYQEVLQTVINADDVKQAIAEHIVTVEAQEIASDAMEDSTVRSRATREVTASGDNDTSVQNLRDAVAEIVTENDSARNQLANIAVQDADVQTAVDTLATSDTKDKMIAALAENLAASDDGTVSSTDVNDAVRDAVQTEKSVTNDASAAASDAIAENETSVTIVKDALQTELQNSTAATDTPVFTVELKGPNNQIINNAPFHFEVGSVDLVLDPVQGFVPGLYTVTVKVGNPITGEIQTFTQQFAWGVLAINPDKDVYNEGESAHLDFGVLDDTGEIVCDAALSLEITEPDGTVKVLSTEDDSIMTTKTCGLKKAGFIGPDFEMDYQLTQEGTYHLTLTGTISEKTRSLHSVIQVKNDAPFVISRKAATRLWPFADSPMDIEIRFNEDISGQVVDTVPEGFIVSGLKPSGDIQKQDDGTSYVIFAGSWKKGETATFHYDYDAPDISPYFYLIGPLKIESDTFFEGSVLSDTGSVLP